MTKPSKEQKAEFKAEGEAIMLAASKALTPIFKNVSAQVVLLVLFNLLIGYAQSVAASGRALSLFDQLIDMVTMAREDLAAEEATELLTAKAEGQA